MFSNNFQCKVKQYWEQLVNHCFHRICSLLAPIPAISISLTQAGMAVVAFSPTKGETYLSKQLIVIASKS